MAEERVADALVDAVVEHPDAGAAAHLQNDAPVVGGVAYIDVG